MEIKRKNQKVVKAQMFSLTALIFILLMVATLLIFVMMDIGYDNLSQSATLSSSSTNYGTILSKSASTFARSSGSAALLTLFNYEINPRYRQDNFISNLSQYMQYLIVNGTLPNLKGGSAGATYITSAMNGETFVSYNSEISSVTGIASKQIKINETMPQIFQSNPYSINIRYTEAVVINTSSGSYNFAIPVNVSVPINNTPDLFYAQQGVYKLVQLTGTKGLVTPIGNDRAISGNTVGFIYGTVNTIVTGSASCTIPTGINTGAYQSQEIIVTANAYRITGAGGCANNYGGLITESINVPPSIPYLVFPPGSNVIPLLQTGQQVLLYGPGYSVLNLTNLINKVSAEYYFTSPYTSSYMDRVSGNFQRQSPNGIFTFFEFDRQGGRFNSLLPGNIKTAIVDTSGTTFTVSGWVYATNVIGNEGLIGQGRSTTQNQWELKLSTKGTCSSGTSLYDFEIFGTTPKDNCFGPLIQNLWQFVTVEYNSGTVTFYLNGNYVSSNPGSPTPAVANLPMYIGLSSGDTSAISFNGMLANFQVYNTLLSNGQIYHLYQEGVEAIPLSNTMLIGWWPMNGNASDLSPYQWTSTPASMTYALLPNYTRDNAYVTPVSGNTFPIPGLNKCNYNSQCVTNSLAHIFISDLPLGLSNGGISTPYFTDRGTSNVLIADSPALNIPETAFSISMWLNKNPYAAACDNILGRSAATSTAILIYEQTKNLCAAGVTNGYNLVFKYTDINGVTHDPSIASAGTPASTWFNAVITYNSFASGGTFVWYINGQTSASTTYTGFAAPYVDANAITIGLNNVGGSNYFNGSISNIQYYSSTLTSAQVLQIYRQGINGQPVDSQHIIGWWPLNGNLNDYSQNGGNGIGPVPFLFVQQNYTSLAGNTYNSIGPSVITGVSNEWQTLGFPSHP